MLLYTRQFLKMLMAWEFVAVARCTDYIGFYHRLYGMGIWANLVLIGESHRNRWKTHEKALEDQRWMFRSMTSEEERMQALRLRNGLSNRGYISRSPAILVS
jgi:hypothetical protein